jgi:cysteine synthase A
MDLRAKLMSTGLLQVIGHTPIMKIQSLSALTGCEIYMKCENLNPGGTVKDRPAMKMIVEAIIRGDLKPGMKIIEGTAGNTGIGLALVGGALGYKVRVVVPKGMAQEKHNMLNLYGAEIVETDAVFYPDERHFFLVAKKIGQSDPNFWWANQFDNPDNWMSHYETTGPEMYAQMDGKIDAVCIAAGSGGTAAGVSKYMKEKNPKIKFIMPDPVGSGVIHYYKEGEFKTDGKYTMAEGVGITRKVSNYDPIIQDDVITVNDQKFTSLAMYVREKEGIVMGMSAVLNLGGALNTAIKYGKDQRIITLLCDGGDRAMTKMYNPQFLKDKGIDGSVPSDKDLLEMFKAL